MKSKSQELTKIEVTTGVYWVQAPKAGLNILCGCPADVVKHLIRLGLIVSTEYKGVTFETGPNAILLSDKLLQNDQFSNLSEFPVLQMLYHQGTILPGHPNNTGVKPLLIGSKEQVEAQKAYIYRGNYGLVTEQELLQAGLDQQQARQQMRIKLKFAFGEIKKTDELIDSCIIADQAVEVRRGLFIRRLAFNIFEFRLGQETVTVDLNMAPNEVYPPPYTLGFYNTPKEYFAVVHSGEGDGWDVHRPCMGSILLFQGKTYLIDTGPNIAASLVFLGIDPTEVDGVFHTHAHDDHFAGLPTLMMPNRRIKYYTSPVVRASVTKKLCALMSMQESEFENYFEIHDLPCGQWNDIDGLEVKPLMSPHPVETSIFLFRAFWQDGYHTYSHLADIASKDVLKGMITTDGKADGISPQHYQEVLDQYLAPADLKKIDIGGGLIHGNAIDFVKDKSSKIALAHKADPLTNQEKAIGSNATFGAVDVLIRTHRNYLKIRAAAYINDLFPQASDFEQELLLNCPIVSFNSGSVIFKNDTGIEEIFLILTGTVEYIDSAKDLARPVNTGSLIGDMDVLEGYDYSGTFRAVSYIQLLQLNKKLYRHITAKQQRP